MYQEYMQETYDQERFGNSQCAHNLHKLQNDPLIRIHIQAAMSSSREIDDKKQRSDAQN
jgi:hypothetical protein